MHPPTAHHAAHQRARRQWQQGQAHAKAGRWEQATTAFRAATRLAPQDPVYALNLARACMQRGRLDLAEEEARRALRIDPRDTIACALVAHCQMETRRYADVVATLQALPADVDRDHDYHELLGRALQALNRPREAIAAYFDALARRVDHAVVHYQLGLCFNELDMKHEGAQCFRTALALGIGHYELGVLGLLAFFEREVCDWPAAEVDLNDLLDRLHALPPDAAKPTTPFAHVTLLSHAADQLRAARSASRHLHTLQSQPVPPRVDRPRRGGRLRVGYVSADFHQHATSILMAEMLEQHDRQRFEVTLYSHGKDDASAMRRRIERSSEHFVDVRELNDRAVAERIRADEIDILVDLKGWTRHHRLGIFAHRAASVQVSYLGFPGTTGADFIDYVIGDRWVTPLEHAAFYSEKIAQMPVCYQPNDRQRALPAPTPRAECGLADDALVLCGFNQPFKISPEVFDTWCTLLQRLPQAVLWLLEWNSQVRSNIVHQAVRRGIDPARIVWAPKLQPAAHMARLQQADLFIDTWPCNAHTTASDALWAAVPVVTFTGETFASRVATSLVHAVGQGALACRDLDHYVATVEALAADAPRRCALRAQLVASRDASPLFDSRGTTRHIESLYERMAARHLAGLPPDHLSC